MTQLRWTNDVPPQTVDVQGWAGTNFPESVFPSMVGKPQLRAEMESLESAELKDVVRCCFHSFIRNDQSIDARDVSSFSFQMCGDEAEAVRFALDINYPVENGIVKNWENMVHLWDYTFFEKLKVNPKDHKIMLTEAPLNPKENRRKTIQNMFEKYQFAGCVHFSARATPPSPLTPSSFDAEPTCRSKRCWCSTRRVC